MHVKEIKVLRHILILFKLKYVIQNFMSDFSTEHQQTLLKY